MIYENGREITEQWYDGHRVAITYELGRIVFEYIVGYIFTNDGFSVQTNDGYMIKCNDQ